MAERGARPPRAEPAGDAPVSADVDRLRRRVEELEAELAAARATIDALIDKAERGTADAPVAVFEAAARLEEIVARRTREVEEKSAALERANAELRALTANLDKIVRQRTRALAESEAQLRRKNEELKRLNMMKAEFISIAAHELRTPMTSIVGYLDLMVEGKFDKLPPGLEKPVASLRRNANRLKRLVDEMLDVSRIEAGRISLYRTNCSLGDIVEDVVQELAPLATAKDQHVHVDTSQAPRIDGDADKIHQVVSNLMANAIRYTPEGGEISLIADRAPEDQYAGAWARLRVRDNGVGIPSAYRQRIFEPFSDVNPAKHHTSSGPDSAGLGLYIARGLVDLHGGLITVDSEEGKFTEFTVLLPLAPQ
ncbi:MAG: sensor histidine kinase [Deltaproteobacteria bacterium]|nr:MAG: sensor histidine kinase [Deltaproteobacteria bacterium]